MAGVAINYVDTINEFHQDHENDENIPLWETKIEELLVFIHEVTKTQCPKNVP